VVVNDLLQNVLNMGSVDLGRYEKTFYYDLEKIEQVLLGDTLRIFEFDVNKIDIEGLRLGNVF
jgi:hypothetical protein